MDVAHEPIRFDPNAAATDRRPWQMDHLRALLRSHAAAALTKSQIIVALALLDRSDSKRSAWPGIDTITNDTGLARRTVLAALKGLEAQNLLRTAKRARETTVYTLIEPAPGLAQGPAPPPDHPPPRTVVRETRMAMRTPRTTVRETRTAMHPKGDSEGSETAAAAAALMQWGFDRTQAEDLVLRYGEKKVNRYMELAAYRDERTPLRSPTGFILSALRGNYSTACLDRQQAKADAAARARQARRLEAEAKHRERKRQQAEAMTVTEARARGLIG